MDSFKSQVIHVVNTVDKLDLPDRLEALSYLQKITEAYKNKSLSSDYGVRTLQNNERTTSKAATNRSGKHKCKNHLCLLNNIKHLKKIACFKCEKRVESEFQLFDHSRTHLDYPVSCMHCRCTFRSVEDYDSHSAADCKRQNKDDPQSVQKYACTVCQTAFANKKAFQSHLLVSHGTKLYNNWYGCKLCREMFEQKKTLYHHYKHVHSDSKCPWEIKSKLNAETSAPDERARDVNGGTSDAMQNGDAENFQCVHCRRSFSKKSTLSVHMRRHMRDKEFVCELCKKSFTVYRNYKRHLQTASHQSKDGLDNHPLFKCKQCAKLFASNDALSRHNLRAHYTDERLFKCPLCDFKTSLAASLSRHVNLHTDNRKFICDQCGSCFHTMSALKEHTVYVHSNERNYSCEICGQRFHLKSGLNRHFKTHSDQKEFKCFCGQVYKFRTNLKRHLMNAHKVTGKKNGILRVTTEEEGYAVNSAKLVLRKAAKQRKTDDDVEESKIDEFDITSLTAFSDVDLSCADEVLRETYDNFSKYSAENGESAESLNSILAPVNNLIDHVLQGKQPLEGKFMMMGNDSAATAAAAATTAAVCLQNHPAPPPPPPPQPPGTAVNYRGATCRQYLTSSFPDLGADPYSQTATIKIDHQHVMNSTTTTTSSSSSSSNSSSFDNANILCGGFNRPYGNVPCLQDMQVDDESSFSYTKWLNEIL